MIAPDLAAQGEEITGMVVEDTDKGEVPLNEGDEVVFQGTVVPVGPRGRIKLPGFLKEVGNQFLVLQITRRAQGTPARTATVSQHLEVLPVRQAGQAVLTAVAQASQITTPGQPLRVTGQGLDQLQKASLVGQDGVEHPLGESVGSSLQRIYLGPKDLPKGNYQFVAQDANGKSYQAPDQCINPTVQITGTQIRRRGQRGQFTVSCNIESDIVLSGGEPQIQLDTNLVHATPQTPGQVGFTALEVGNYTLRSRILNREDVPPDPQAPRVDAKPEPVQARYDPSRNETNVSCPVNIVDQKGQPVANVPVDVACSHPNGVQYQRLNTDNRGRANFLHTFAGQLAANAVAVQAYRVLGRAWNKQPPPPQPPPKPQPPGPEEKPLPPTAAGGVGAGGPGAGGPHPRGLPGDHCTTGLLPVKEKGPGIKHVDVLTPWDAKLVTKTDTEIIWKTESKANDAVSLVVKAWDIDKADFSCACLDVGGGVNCTSKKVFEWIDVLVYKWEESPPAKKEEGLAVGPGGSPSGKKGEFLFPYLHYGFVGPAALYLPPELKVGAKAFTAHLISKIQDFPFGHGDDPEATVDFYVEVVRDKDDHYIRTVMAKKHTSIMKDKDAPLLGEAPKLLPEFPIGPLTTTGSPCPCQGHAKWAKGLIGEGEVKFEDVKACPGQQVVLHANGYGYHKLTMDCEGDCGHDEKPFSSFDDTRYIWSAKDGSFGAYGTKDAKEAVTNGWTSSVIYTAPTEPGEYIVTLDRKDSGKQRWSR